MYVYIYIYMYNEINNSWESLCVGAYCDYGTPAALRPYKFPLERFAATCRAIRVAALRIRWFLGSLE